MHSEYIINASISDYMCPVYCFCYFKTIKYNYKNQEDKMQNQNDNEPQKDKKAILKEASMKLSELILSKAPPKMPLRVLEAGTGSGLISIFISQNGHNVTGIDLDEEKIELAKENSAKEVSEVDFLTMDIKELLFSASVFDLIIAKDTLSYADSLQSVYEEFDRVLKPGGKIIIIETSKPSFSLSAAERPALDCELLLRLGYEKLDIKTEELRAVRPDKYDENCFMLIAEKARTAPKKEENIKKYWKELPPSEEDICLKDLHSEKAQTYCEMVMNLAPRKRDIRILEIGTSGGFLAIALALRGYSVTGIDISNSMIMQAAENARIMKADVNFICAEADDLPFENEQFDIVLSRNVVWNLSNPELAFSQWYRVLSNYGRLIYFDGDWQNQPFDEDYSAYYSFFRSQTRPKDRLSFYADDAADIKVFSSRSSSGAETRPEWDRRVLSKWGLIPIYMKCDISDQIWDEKEKSLYYMTQQFLIAAEKSKKVRTLLA